MVAAAPLFSLVLQLRLPSNPRILLGFLFLFLYFFYFPISEAFSLFHFCLEIFNKVLFAVACNRISPAYRS